MGFFGKLIAKLGDKSIKLTTDTLFKSYLILQEKYPDLPKQDVFRRVLTARYSKTNFLIKENIDEIASSASNTIGLTLAVIAHEDPIAIGEYLDSTIQIVSDYFAAHAPEELRLFNNDQGESDVAYACTIALRRVRGKY